MATADTPSTKADKPGAASAGEKVDVAKLEKEIADLEAKLEEARAKLRRAQILEFPKVVYKAAAPDVPVSPSPPPEVASLTVASADEEAAAKKDGYAYTTPAEAQAAVAGSAGGPR